MNTPEWTHAVRLIPARDIVAGMALVVRPGNGYAPWIGPMIATVTTGADVVAIHTVNGGGKAFAASDMVHVVDTLADHQCVDTTPDRCGYCTTCHADIIETIGGAS